MITKITGRLVELGDEKATLEVPPFEYEVLVPDFSRRRLQTQMRQQVSLFTLHYIDGNVSKGGRMTPRLVGFTSEIEREFFELFCSVDGVGVKKALRAMVRPVPDVAAAIEQQDSKVLSTLPGIGGATADRVIAKLKRKMPKFALLVTTDVAQASDVDRDIVEETWQILVTLGHNEAEARKLIDEALASKKTFKDVESMLQSVYEQSRSH